jgi:membrane protein YdbS with pleckstrin-like domain
MAVQLRLVPPEGNSPQDVLTFRADARPALWGAAFFALGSLVGAGLGFADQVPHLPSAVAAALLLFVALWLAAAGVGQRSVRYSLSASRLEIERGLLGRRLESMELWRVRDVVLDQSLLQRLRGVGRLTLYSTDRVEPVLSIGPVAGARELFERVRDGVAMARKDARVVPVDG